MSVQTEREHIEAEPAQTEEKKDSHSPLDDTDEHILHLWEPLSFTTTDGYDYLRPRPLQRLETVLLRTLGKLLLLPANHIMFGLEVRERDNMELVGSRGAVMICNHVHPMDCTFIDTHTFGRRMHYITLESNFKIPVVRRLIRSFGGVPLSRSPHKMRDMFNNMSVAINNGAFVQIYPEAVLDPYCAELRTFRQGAFRLAVDAAAPVIPVVLTQRDPDGLFAMYKNKPCFTMTVLEPQYPDIKLARNEAVSELCTRCRAAMQKVMNDAKNDADSSL